MAKQKMAPKKKVAAKKKVKKVLHEYKEGKLHSGSKKGPKVVKKSQALAIALNGSRKSVKKPKKK